MLRSRIHYYKHKQDLTFPIIKDRKSKKIFVLYGVLFISIICFVIGAIYTKKYEKVNNLMTQIFSVLFIAGMAIWTIGIANFKKYLIVGIFKLKESSIIIVENDKSVEYRIGDIDNIIVKYNCYEGESTSYFYGTLSYNDGRRNFIEFTANNVDHKHEFLLKEPSWVALLQKRIAEWEKNYNIKIKFMK